MTRAEIVEKINTIFQDEFEIKPEQIHPEAQLNEDLDLDSLDAVDLIVALEQEFGGRVCEEKARAARTVNDIYNLIDTAQTISAA